MKSARKAGRRIKSDNLLMTIGGRVFGLSGNVRRRVFLGVVDRFIPCLNRRFVHGGLYIK